jgi:hypothetical protein
MTDIFAGFEDIEFPRSGDIVYALYFRWRDEKITFYIGQSSRHLGRLGDYISAKFSCCPDFKVGEAIKYLRSRNLDVRFRYRQSADPKEEEKRLLQEEKRRLKECGKEYRLLNEHPGYDYRTCDIEEKKRKVEEEKLKVHDFMRELVRTSTCDMSDASNEAGNGKTDGATLTQIKVELAHEFITDPQQKRVFLDDTKSFKQWANYIAALALTKDGISEFTPKQIRAKLRELLEGRFDQPGARSSSLLTADVEIGSDYHGGLPCLKRVEGTHRYRFVGFQRRSTA